MIPYAFSSWKIEVVNLFIWILAVTYSTQNVKCTALICLAVTWLCSHLTTQSSGYAVIWLRSHLTMQSSGYAVIWLRSHLITQSSGYMQSSDYAVVWLCSHLATYSSHLITQSSGHIVCNCLYILPVRLHSSVHVPDCWDVYLGMMPNTLTCIM